MEVLIVMFALDFRKILSVVLRRTKKIFLISSDYGILSLKSYLKTHKEFACTFGRKKNCHQMFRDSFNIGNGHFENEKGVINIDFPLATSVSGQDKLIFIICPEI